MLIFYAREAIKIGHAGARITIGHALFCVCFLPGGGGVVESRKEKSTANIPKNRRFLYRCA